VIDAGISAVDGGVLADIEAVATVGAINETLRGHEVIGHKEAGLALGREGAVATPLAGGDEIRIGAVALIFRIGSEETATMSMPPEGA